MSSNGIVQRFRDTGFSFRILPADEVAGFLPELKAISDAWLRSKGVREKQFSIARSMTPYLASYPCALLQDAEGNRLHSPNILQRPNHGEFSIDLMRYLPDCPIEVRDLFLLHLIEWGRGAQFPRLNLGLAPLAALGIQPAARGRAAWPKILFSNANIGQFQGDPPVQAEVRPAVGPRYLAYPASWIWPSDSACAALIAAAGECHLPNEKQAGSDDSLRAPDRGSMIQ